MAPPFGWRIGGDRFAAEAGLQAGRRRDATQPQEEIADVICANSGEGDSLAGGRFERYAGSGVADDDARLWPYMVAIGSFGAMIDGRLRENAIEARHGNTMGKPVLRGHRRGRQLGRQNAGAEHGEREVAGVEVDRKILADLAVREPEAFKTLVGQAEAALTAAA